MIMVHRIVKKFHIVILILSFTRKNVIAVPTLWNADLVHQSDRSCIAICFPQTVDASSTAICCATQQLKFQTSIVGKNVEIVNLLCLVISLSVSRFIHQSLVEFRRLWICWPSDTLQCVLANTSRFLVDDIAATAR